MRSLLVLSLTGPFSLAPGWSYGSLPGTQSFSYCDCRSSSPSAGASQTQHCYVYSVRIPPISCLISKGIELYVPMHPEYSDFKNMNSIIFKLVFDSSYWWPGTMTHIASWNLLTPTKGGVVLSVCWQRMEARWTPGWPWAASPKKLNHPGVHLSLSELASPSDDEINIVLWGCWQNLEKHVYEEPNLWC